MKKILLSCALMLSCLSALADQYVVKYIVKGEASSTHAQTTIELKHGTAEEAKEALVKRGTVSEKNKDNIVIVEIKKK